MNEIVGINYYQNQDEETPNEEPIKVTLISTLRESLRLANQGGAPIVLPPVRDREDVKLTDPRRRNNRSIIQFGEAKISLERMQPNLNRVPEEREGVVWLVPMPVAMHPDLYGRKDIVCPGGLFYYPGEHGERLAAYSGLRQIYF